MATITFTNGEQTQVHATKAIRLWFIQTGRKSGNPEIMKFLKQVKTIQFDTAKKPIPQARLPYID